MKRHEKLAPLSRDHHKMLLLARLIRDDAPAYKGLPTEKEEKIVYAKDTYEELIKPHFLKEERLFAWVAKQDDEELFTLSEELLAEHKSIFALFESLSIDSMDKTGRFLEDHIRKEERSYFQKIQERFDCSVIDL